MIKGMSHTGVGVANLEDSINLYESLGFIVTKRFEKPEPSAKVAWVEKGDMAIELWEFHDTEHEQVKFITNHIAFDSDDLENDLQDFIDQGYKLVIPITEGVIKRYFFVQDASGATYEVAADKTGNS